MCNQNEYTCLLTSRSCLDQLGQEITHHPKKRKNEWFYQLDLSILKNGAECLEEFSQSIPYDSCQATIPLYVAYGKQAATRYSGVWEVCERGNK